MRLIVFLLRSSWVTVAIASIAGALSGVGSVLLIASINRAIGTPGQQSAGVLAQFLGLAVITLLAASGSQILLARLSQQAIYKMRLQLSHWILACPLRQLETLGPNRILASLTDDIDAISSTVFNLPLLLVNAALVIGCLGYLAWLSVGVFLAILVVIGVAIVVIQVMLNSVYALLRLARDQKDLLFKHFRSITDGVKELKLNLPRRFAFIEEDLETTAAAFRDYEVQAETVAALTLNFSSLLFFGILGFLVFGLPQLTDITTPVLSAYALTITYLARPIENLMTVLPVLSRGSVALKKIDELGLSLASQAETTGAGAHLPRSLHHQIELDNVTHTYHTDRDGQFTLGPVSLAFKPGDLVFIVGGNGSGKSTLAKLIAGLYAPETGTLRWDGNPVEGHNLDAYRQLFAAVFSDFYLFERLLGLQLQNLDDRAQHYLQHLQLDHKVQVNQGVLSTLDLSQGQRKRLALLTAYLDDRPICLFDEWASDQDPQFREVFYKQILLELKRRGKAVLVISHDDRYFHLADQLIKLEYGQRIDEGL
ncbi:cyclic peptide export ABC transporter [Leptolyngbya sp. KIOST-1]|uniref:cyclic peptide export ABC transporter n=1 Tax=Leptolyngbya sp. KIOST-1 TaxID=1229172 RepID=UPI00055E724E|nr:cyclic peptide export ABC transporter [Leptolyngbya sp. KIOST-1]